MASGTLVSVAYLGTEITHLQSAEPLNQSVYIPGAGDANGNCFLNGSAVYFKVAPGAACSTLGNTQDRRRLSLLRTQFKDAIGRMGDIVNGGTQSYNGALISIQKRAGYGITVNANYTWSHCIGDYMGRANSGYGTSVDQTYQDPNNRRKDRGNCEVDARHVFNLTSVAETPKFANRTLNMVGTGWRLSVLYRALNGAINAANAGTLTDANGANVFTGMANVTGGTNTDAFTLSGTGNISGTIAGGAGTGWIAASRCSVRLRSSSGASGGAEDALPRRIRAPR